MDKRRGKAVMKTQPTRFTRDSFYQHIEKMKVGIRAGDPAQARAVIPFLNKLQDDIRSWIYSKPFEQQQTSLAIKDRQRLDDGLLNFGFRRLPLPDPPVKESQGGQS